MLYPGLMVLCFFPYLLHCLQSVGYTFILLKFVNRLFIDCESYNPVVRYFKILPFTFEECSTVLF